MNEIPNSFLWFTKLNLVKFIPWQIQSDLSHFSSVNLQFKKECSKRNVVTFASRQDMDSFAGFEVVDGKITDKILVFHLTFSNNSNWNIIEAEYDDLFHFVRNDILPTMKDWISGEEIDF